MDPSVTLPPFERSRHPDAQWFPEAGFGLFLHWGIHSVAAIQPSWAMIKNYPHGGDPRFHPPERYYTLANEFNPQNYNPERWAEATARAGFQYMVLTTKHHDGYALWPTRFGEMSTRRFMNERDLLRPYVDALRAHDLKMGFYFSQRDWSYPGYPLMDVDFDREKRGQYPPTDPDKNQRAFEAFYQYTVGQIEELLSGYGTVDLLWFDGLDWPDVDIRTVETLDWIREKQPGIIMNQRWGGVGDFVTPECHFPEQRPVPEGQWWEYCNTWVGHWGYSPNSPWRDLSWVLETLSRTRAWGGNFLLNLGPAPDGTLPEQFYTFCDQLEAWMQHSKESVIGTQGTPGDDRANVPITRREGIWYLHVLPGHEGSIVLHGVNPPRQTLLLPTGESLPTQQDGPTLRLELGPKQRSGLVDVIKLVW